VTVKPAISSQLLISNFPSVVTDEELIALVSKYAPELECIDVRRFARPGRRPAALLSFMRMNLNALEDVSERLSGMYWKGRTLLAGTIPGLSVRGFRSWFPLRF